MSPLEKPPELQQFGCTFAEWSINRGRHVGFSFGFTRVSPQSENRISTAGWQPIPLTIFCSLSRKTADDAPQSQNSHESGDRKGASWQLITGSMRR